MKLAENNSIIYETLFSTLFNDLDMYGHLNSSRYLDYLTTSRFSFPMTSFGLEESFFLKKDLGFFVKAYKIHFVRPIMGLREFGVRSWMLETDGCNILLEVEFFCPVKETIFSVGKLNICAVSIKNGRPKAVDEDIWQYLTKLEVSQLPMVKKITL